MPGDANQIPAVPPAVVTSDPLFDKAVEVEATTRLAETVAEFDAMTTAVKAQLSKAAEDDTAVIARFNEERAEVRKELGLRMSPWSPAATPGAITGVDLAAGTDRSVEVTASPVTTPPAAPSYSPAPSSPIIGIDMGATPAAAADLSFKPTTPLTGVVPGFAGYPIQTLLFRLASYLAGELPELLHVEPDRWIRAIEGFSDTLDTTEHFDGGAYVADTNASRDALLDQVNQALKDERAKTADLTRQLDTTRFQLQQLAHANQELAARAKSEFAARAEHREDAELAQSRAITLAITAITSAIQIGADYWTANTVPAAGAVMTASPSAPASAPPRVSDQYLPGQRRKVQE